MASAGNDSRDGRAKGLAASRYTIAVAAIGDRGFAATCSNHKACVLVGAPGSEFESESGLRIVTTDLPDADGCNLRGDTTASADYTDDFGGTSTAGPIVATVAALMLDANPALGWPGVQHMLAASATPTVVSLVNCTLAANLETLQVTGALRMAELRNDFVNRITGNSGGNLLQGMGGNDVLFGLAGSNTLQGAAEADRFLFASLRGSVDRILDFATGTDVIAVTTVFGGGLSVGVLAAVRFPAQSDTPTPAASGIPII